MNNTCNCHTKLVLLNYKLIESPDNPKHEEIHLH